MMVSDENNYSDQDSCNDEENLKIKMECDPNSNETEENSQGLEVSLSRDDDVDMGVYNLQEHFTVPENNDGSKTMDVNNVKGASAKTLYTRIRTYNNETGRKQSKYRCNFCEKEFKDKGPCIWHIRVHTGGETPYKCEECCKQSFPSESHLIRH